jgi:hypothetical protein
MLIRAENEGISKILMPAIDNDILRCLKLKISILKMPFNDGATSLFGKERYKEELKTVEEYFEKEDLWRLEKPVLIFTG